MPLFSNRLAGLVALLAIGCGIAALNGPAESPTATLFWTQSPHGGADERGGISSLDLNTPSVIEHLVSGAKAPGGIAVGGDYVYWANYATAEGWVLPEATGDGSSGVGP